MTDHTTPPPRKTDRFGFNLGIENSERRKQIAMAHEEGERFKGITDRDIALMVERGVHTIVASQTYRGKFLGEIDKACVLALYIAGTAASEDAIRLFDAIAENRIRLDQLLALIKQHLEAVKMALIEEEQAQRKADAAADAWVLAEAADRESKRNSDGGTVPN